MRLTVAAHPMTPADWGLILTLSALWGGAFFFNQVAVADVPVLSVVLARVALAAALLWSAAALVGLGPPRTAKIWGALLLMGCLNNAIPFVLIVWGQATIGASAASILNASTPLFTVLLADRLTADEPLSRARLAGVLLGLGGVAVLLGGATVSGRPEVIAAQAACLAAAVSYALAGIFGRRFRAWQLPPVVTAAGQVTASSLVLLPLVLVLDRPWTLTPPGPPAVGALLAVATLSTALAYVVYFRLLARTGAGNVLLVTLLVPVTAVLLGATVLGESVGAREFAGMALIAAGLLIIDGRAARALRQRAAGSGRRRRRPGMPASAPPGSSSRAPGPRP